GIGGGVVLQVDHQDLEVPGHHADPALLVAAAVVPAVVRAPGEAIDAEVQVEVGDLTGGAGAVLVVVAHADAVGHAVGQRGLGVLEPGHGRTGDRPLLGRRAVVDDVAVVDHGQDVVALAVVADPLGLIVEVVGAPGVGGVHVGVVLRVGQHH